MLKRLIKWTAAAMAAVGVLVIVVNAFDEDLDPEVKAYLEARAPSVPDARNGYFQVVGLAMAGEDAHAAGRRYIAAVHAAQEKRLAGEPAEWPRIERLPVADELSGVAAFCEMDVGASCLERVRADERAARRLLKEQETVLERYRALLEYPGYVETLRLQHYDTPLPDAFGLGVGQRLFHMQAALHLLEGRALLVAYDLERSLRLSRRMLVGSSTVMGKMLAAAHARRAALFVSQALPAIARADRKALARLAEALAPLSPAERGLSLAYRSELAMAASAMHECGGAEPTLACYFFQPNATLNRLYFAFHKPLLELAAAPAHRFDELRAAFPDIASPWWSMLYNPWGKAMLAASAPRAPWGYVARLNDLDGLFRIVALRALIGERRLKAAEVPGFLAGSVKRWADPYSGGPMGWDPKRRELWFEPRATPALQAAGGEHRRFSVGLI